MNTFEKKRTLRGLNMGDIVSCSDGNQYEFIRMKKTKFLGKHNGVTYDIPADMFVEVVEQTEKKSFDPSQLEEGELFYILDSKQQGTIFRFKYMINSNKVMAENPITKTGVRMSLGLIKGTVRELQS